LSPQRDTGRRTAWPVTLSSRGQEIHHKPPGLGDGRGAVSLQVRCETQVEVDYFWGKLTNGGQEGPCGWQKDKYGLSWQVVPAAIPKMMTDADPAKSECHERFLENEKARHRSDRRAYAGQPQ
jgi:hypothetical protein